MSDQETGTGDQGQQPLAQGAAPSSRWRGRRLKIALLVTAVFVAVPLFFWARHQPFIEPVFANPETPCQEMLNVPPILLMDVIMSSVGDRRVNGEHFMQYFERQLKENQCTIEEVTAFMDPRARFIYQSENRGGVILRYRYRSIIRNPFQFTIRLITGRHFSLSFSFNSDEKIYSMGWGVAG